MSLLRLLFLEIKKALLLEAIAPSIVRLSLWKIKMAYKLSVKVTKVRQRVVQFRESNPRQYCQCCMREVEMLTYAEAVQVLRVDQQTLAGLIGDGSIHTIQFSGAFRVCKESLSLS